MWWISVLFRGSERLICLILEKLEISICSMSHLALKRFCFKWNTRFEKLFQKMSILKPFSMSLLASSSSLSLPLTLSLSSTSSSQPSLFCLRNFLLSLFFSGWYLEFRYNGNWDGRRRATLFKWEPSEGECEMHWTKTVFVHVSQSIFVWGTYR